MSDLAKRTEAPACTCRCASRLSPFLATDKFMGLSVYVLIPRYLVGLFLPGIPVVSFGLPRDPSGHEPGSPQLEAAV